MADNLNQVGKYIRKNKDDSKRLLDRAIPQYPTTESIRDIFDYKIGFKMSFKTFKAYPTTVLHLEFFGKPPSIGCCTDCYCVVCESFPIGSQTLDVGRVYISGTVTLFIGDLQSTAFSETSPSTGIITLTSVSTEIVKACYVYSYCN